MTSIRVSPSGPTTSWSGRNRDLATGASGTPGTSHANAAAPAANGIESEPTTADKAPNRAASSR